MVANFLIVLPVLAALGLIRYYQSSSAEPAKPL